MLTQEPKLSVICVFRNKKEWIEPTLKALYAIHRTPCEFIFIDDGSTDGSAEAIRSLVEFYQHNQTFFFEQEVSRGRGNSLNSAIEHARGRFLWIPENVHSINRERLLQAIETLQKSEAHVAIGMDDHLPEDPLDWLRMLQNDRLPFDRHYLFDLRKIRPGRIYTDPHWTTRHATEWAIRIQPDANPVRVAPFSEGNDDQLFMDDRSKKECVLALLRVPELSLSGQEKAFRMLRTFGHTDFEEEAESLEPLYHEARELYKSGNSVAALELLNRILASEPGHRRARNFKVEILERLRRYVEASEVKHRHRAEDRETASRDKAGRTGDDPEDVTDPQQSDDPVDQEHDMDQDTDRSIPDQPVIVKPETFDSDFESKDSNKSDDNKEGAVMPESADKELEGTEKPEEPGPTSADGSGEQDNEKETSDEQAIGEEEDEYQAQKQQETNRELAGQPALTVIIPTATYRRPVLEKCLNTLFRFTSREKTRVIVINNGSVDDTAEYLDNLLKKGLPLTVLSNDKNPGFAASVNQGLAKAGDGYVLVMHNDVALKEPTPARLARILEEHADIGLVTPKTDHTWNPMQSCHDETAGGDTPEKADSETDVAETNENDKKPGSDLTETDIVEGYCMAFRNEPGLVLSKDYGLAFFEDTDFCLRIQNKGYRIVIAEQERVHHTGGITTSDLGIARYSKNYWHNSAIFHKNWEIEPRFPSERTKDDPLHQLTLLGKLINPFYPEKHLLDYFSEIFTSEQRTRVFHAEFPPEALKAMIRLMMATNQRETLRRLEQQLQDLPADQKLYHELIAFYFDRTIYSRCKLYLNRLEQEVGLTVTLILYRLKIAIGEKDYELAASILQQMMDHAPTHPEGLISAAEIHRRNDNHEQSEKFAALAKTFNPFLKWGR